MTFEFNDPLLIAFDRLTTLFKKYGHIAEVSLLEFEFHNEDKEADEFLNIDVNLIQAYDALEELAWFSDYLKITKNFDRKDVEAYMRLVEPKHGQQNMPRFSASESHIDSLKQKLNYKIEFLPDFNGEKFIEDISSITDRNTAMKAQKRLAIDFDNFTVQLRGHNQPLLLITAPQQKFVLEQLHKAPSYTCYETELKRIYSRIDKRANRKPQKDRPFKKTVDNLNALIYEHFGIKDLVKHSNYKKTYWINADYI